MYLKTQQEYTKDTRKRTKKFTPFSKLIPNP